MIEIVGGRALKGRVHISGAKNSITKLLVASLLSDKPCRFFNVPNIEDVKITVMLCKEIGMDIDWDVDKGRMDVCTKSIKKLTVSQKYCGANRIPILLLGVLLGRTKEDISVPVVGGCNLGRRPVNFHINALRALGACVEYCGEEYLASARDGLKGTVIELEYPSVGATENVILAATRAEGITLIKNAAIEPEILDLILFLQKFGVDVSLNNNREIQIKKCDDFFPVEHFIVSDRISAASFAMCAIATKGRVFVEGAKQRDMILFLNKIRQIGGKFEIKSNGIEFFYDKKLQGNVHIETDLYPGFATDCQQGFVVLLTQTEGISVIHETVYENRFNYVKALQDMGANIALFSNCLGKKSCRYEKSEFLHSLVVSGKTYLEGQRMEIPDLRAGFAYLMAGLVASGKSTLGGLNYLYRGYENPIEKLQNLGADISFVENTIPTPQLI